MIKDNEFVWAEKYRPRKVSECILPDRLKKPFEAMAKKGQMPDLLLVGTSGIGKTTVAIALAEETDSSYMLIPASDERGIDMLRNKIRNYASTKSLNGKPKIIILDEADGLTGEAQAALRGAMQTYSSNCTFILTGNFKDKLIPAIHSRCTVIDFRLNKSEVPEIASKFMKRVCTILEDEGIGYEKNVVAQVVTKYFPDFRRTINELQRLAADIGEINEDILSLISDVRNIEELYGFLKEKNFRSMRKWVVEHGDVDPARIFRVIYDSLYDNMQPSSIPSVVISLARYQSQAAFVADQEINLVAFLTELMVEGEFK